MKLAKLHRDRRWNAVWMLQLLLLLLALSMAGVAWMGLPLLGGAAIAVLLAAFAGAQAMVTAMPERALIALAWAVGGLAVATALLALAVAKG